MASKADQWRRMHQLFRSPHSVFTQNTEPGYTGLWTTDRYVIVNHYAAALPVAEPGAWTLRTTSEPKPEQYGGQSPRPEYFRARLDDFAGREYDPLAVTPWSWTEGQFSNRLLTTSAGRPAWVLDGVIRGWQSLVTKGDTLQLGLDDSAKVIRATVQASRGEQLLGYLMTVRIAAPELPQITATAA